MLKKVGIGLAVIIVLFVLVSFLLPSNAIVTRSITINAPIEIVYDQVANFHNWSKWSAWAAKDPNMKLEFTGPERGKGAKYCWDGDPDAVGKGCLEITDAKENTSISTFLQFEGMGEGRGSWQFEKISDGVKVTWTMDSDMSKPMIIGRYFGLMMDNMVGPDFEQGLNALKGVSESIPAYAIEINEETLPTMVYIHMRAKANNSTMSDQIDNISQQLMAFITKNNLEQVGAPFSIYYDMNEEFNFSFAIPVVGNIPHNENGIEVAELLETPCIKGIFNGDYQNLGTAHLEIQRYMSDNSKNATGPPMEVYITDPSKENDPNKWITHVIYPI